MSLRPEHAIPCLGKDYTVISLAAGEQGGAY